MKYIQCPDCHALLPEGQHECGTCGYFVGGNAQQAPSVHIFPAGWWEHLTLEPVYIKNRKQLREVCAANGVRANILD